MSAKGSALKILHVDTGREMRGGQHQVLLLAKGLHDHGHENIVLARSGSPLFQAASGAGFETESAGWAAIFRNSRRVDLVHVHDARGHTLAAGAARCPIVVSRRVAFPVRQSLPSTWKYRRAARYLAVSRCVAAELSRAGIAAAKIDVIYDAVPDEVQPGIGTHGRRLSPWPLGILKKVETWSALPRNSPGSRLTSRTISRSASELHPCLSTSHVPRGSVRLP